MSVDGFNRQFRPRGVRSNGDFIAIHFDPEKTDVQDVLQFMEAIHELPPRDRQTVFAIEPEGMYFRRVH